MDITGTSLKIGYNGADGIRVYNNGIWMQQWLRLSTSYGVTTSTPGDLILRQYDGTSHIVFHNSASTKIFEISANGNVGINGTVGFTFSAGYMRNGAEGGTCKYNLSY